MRISPEYSVTDIEGVGMFVVSEKTAHVHTDALEVALIRHFAQGPSTDDAAAKAVAPEAPYKAYYAISILTARGVLRADDGGDVDADRRTAYWALRGVKAASPPDAPITVLAWDDSAPGARGLSAALEAIGLPVQVSADASALTSASTPLVIAQVSDLLDPRLAELNALALKAELPWLIVATATAYPTVGPLFEPGQTGCWECMAQRLEGNRQVETFLRQRVGEPETPHGRAFHPAAAQLAYAAAASIAAHRLEGDDVEAGVVLRYDAARTEPERHILTRRPQCPACGDPDIRVQRVLQRPDFESRQVQSTDGAFRSLTLDDAWRKASPHVSPITGAVKMVEPVIEDTSDALHAYTAGHNFAVNYDGLAFLRKSLRVRSGGKGRSDIEARVGAVYEAMERYSAVFRGDEPTVMASYAELGDTAIWPKDVMLYSDRQYAEREQLNFDSRDHQFSSQFIPKPLPEDAPVEWTPVHDVRNGVTKYIPTGLCYFNYASFRGFETVKDLYFLADSNGHAAGTSLEDATLQGSLELVERDAVGIWWYNRLRMPEFDLSTVKDPYIARAQDRLAAIGRNLWAIDLTNDIGLPVICAASIRTNHDRQELVFGFGAHLTADLAALRAVTELAQFLAAFERWGETDRRYVAFDAVAERWWKTVTVESQPYFLPSGAPIRTADTSASLVGADVRDLALKVMERIETTGTRTYILDQTLPDIEVPVVKVIAPGLRHMWSRFASGRLYDVPVQMGLLDAPTKEEDLNPWAVFF